MADSWDDFNNLSPNFGTLQSYSKTNNDTTKKILASALSYPLNDNKNIPYIVFTAQEYKLLPPDDNSEKVLKGKGLGAVKLYAPGGIKYNLQNTWQDENYYLSWSGATRSLKEKAKQYMPVIDQLIQMDGNTIYPSSVLLYQQTSKLTFGINYKFVPRNAKEAKVVSEIVEFFRMCSLPAQEKGWANKYQLLIKPPPIFKIFLSYSSKSQSSSASDTIKYENMVIESFDVTYSEGESSFLIYEDGQPVSTSITLSFKSITPTHPIKRKQIDGK